ncbi:hypothetical protein P152DRAFT_379143, partial [Eremomyces bilateralis CBS 781.70]
MPFRQSSYGQYVPCDSFFVESDEDALYAAREQQRRRTRAIAEMQQRTMGQELSKLTAEEYQDDVLAHMVQMESATMPDVSSIDIQTEIQWYMRPYLLDFLVEAHAAFQLLPETLFLTVNLLDRYCSKRVVYKRHYQLVGCAALLIAAKYGDRKEHVPTIKELRSMCCSLYDEDMFIQMEWHVLQTLNWMVGHSTVDSFVQIAMSSSTPDPEVEHMTLYIAEVALFHRDFVSVTPSVLARSSMAIARHILSRPQASPSDWAGMYDHSTVMNLSHCLYQPSQVLVRKYSSNQLSGVASTVEDFLQQQLALSQRNAAVAPVEVTVTHEEHRVAPQVGTQVPQTPQKTMYAGSVMANGCITPPITPDGDQY